MRAARRARAALAGVLSLALAGLASVAARADGPLAGPGVSSGGGGGGGSTTTLTLRTISSGNTDTAQTTDSTIVWNSATGVAKSEVLFACVLGQKGHVITIKDGAGTAATYNITLTPNGGDTIDGDVSEVLPFNRQANTVTCDGSGHWQQL